MAEKEQVKQSYTAKDIQVLEGLEPVRKRPGMYIGSTGVEGLHHLIWEVFDNGLDEAMGGHVHNIEVVLMPDNKVRVSDDGRGIPTDIHPKTKKSALETAATTLHAGGKFEQGAYKVSGGLHGVGLSVVNALSIWMRAEVHRKPDIFAQEYKIGKPTGPVKKVGTTKKTGTIITFQPDPSIFQEINFDLTTILNHLRQQAYLTKGVKVTVKDEREKIARNYTFYFEGGIVSYVEYLNRNEEVKHKTVFYVAKEQDNIFVEVAMQYTDEISGKELSFANNVHTTEGGMHLTGFKSAITRTLNDYARKNGFIKEKEDNLSGDDVREGLTSIISVKLKDPQFEGQTKSKLGTPDARTAVESVINVELADWLERNPLDSRQIMEKVLLASKARLAAKAARETVLRKGAMEGMTLPGKLRDCSSRDPSESELFIVEGDSAGGSATQGRDRHTQAILPLKGKILNVEKARLDRMLTSQEIRALIIALGTAIAEEFDLGKLRYHKIVIMTDADTDGSHIRTLLLTLFYRYFPQLINNGHLYIAQPPLYRIQKGSKINYAYNDQEKEKILDGLRKIIALGEGSRAKPGISVDGQAGETKAKAKKSKDEEWEVTPVDGGEVLADEESSFAKAAYSAEVATKAGSEDETKIAGVTIQRYKGLGEMNPEQLWETTLDPVNRMLLQVTVKDAQEADRVFDVLMGAEVMPRKKFIQTHAKSVQNLDI